jgi:predicted nucleic acid-binding protein
VEGPSFRRPGCFHIEQAHLAARSVATGAGVVSYQVVQEFFNVALRRFARPMSPEEAQQYLATVFRPLLAVESSLNLLQHGLYVCRRFNFSWFDSLIVAAAREARCEVLYTEDPQDEFEIEGLRIENPFL